MNTTIFQTAANMTKNFIPVGWNMTKGFFYKGGEAATAMTGKSEGVILFVLFLIVVWLLWRRR